MMNYPGQQLLPVGGPEAELVQRHTEMMARYKRKTEKDDGLIRPIIFFENEADGELHRQCLELTIRKQQEYGLDTPPKLIPFQPQPVWQPPSSPHFYECRRSEPTDLEQARLFIYRQHVRTRNGSVYLYNGKCYNKLSDDQLKSQILSILRDELEIKGNSK